MPALLPAIIASSYLVLAANQIPQFDVEPSCRAAAQAATTLNRNAGNCIQDEHNARAKLDQQWGDFTASQQTHCLRLSALGGLPSYVELLTCLEMAKEAAAIPDATRPVGR
ncbi:MAG: hypothetical protein WC670_16180 [Pseudolabrys sp.]|jgi:hypothetical protein